MNDTPETEAAYKYWPSENAELVDAALARKLERERDEAREQAQRLRVQLNHYTQANEMAEQAFRERDEARTVLERIVKLSINARRVEEDYVEWEKAVLAILDICEERKEK